MTLLLVAGQLWWQTASSDVWWTLEDCGPGLYRYAYSDDPTRDMLAPAPQPVEVESGGRMAGGPGGFIPRREEPEALESALGPAGRASRG